MKRNLVFGGFLIFALTIIFNLATMAQTESGFDVRGKVMSVKQLKSKNNEKSLGTIFVERTKVSDSKIDKAYVSINDKTLIFIQEADVQREAKFADIRRGDRVEVRFVPGPRIMIYPTQAVAAEIVIMRKGAKPKGK